MDTNIFLLVISAFVLLCLVTASASQSEAINTPGGNPDAKKYRFSHEETFVSNPQCLYIADCVEHPELEVRINLSIDDPRGEVWGGYRWFEKGAMNAKMNFWGKYHVDIKVKNVASSQEVFCVTLMDNTGIYNDWTSTYYNVYPVTNLIGLTSSKYSTGGSNPAYSHALCSGENCHRDCRVEIRRGEEKTFSFDGTVSQELFKRRSTWEGSSVNWYLFIVPPVETGYPAWTDGINFYPEGDTRNLGVQVIPTGNCDSDADCEDDEVCTTEENGESLNHGYFETRYAGYCKVIVCGDCEYLENKECEPYDCCSNERCKGDEQCDVAKHKCEKLVCGDCSYIANNTCVNYECCADSDCTKANQVCREHECKVVAPPASAEPEANKTVASQQGTTPDVGTPAKAADNSMLYLVIGLLGGLVAGLMVYILKVRK